MIYKTNWRIKLQFASIKNTASWILCFHNIHNILIDRGFFFQIEKCSYTIEHRGKLKIYNMILIINTATDSLPGRLMNHSRAFESD